jgi:rubrerythrin
MTTIDARHTLKIEELKNNECIAIELKANIADLVLYKSSLSCLKRSLNMDSLIFKQEQKLKDILDNSLDKYMKNVLPIITEYNKCTKIEDSTNVFSIMQNSGTLSGYVEQRVNNNRGELYNRYLNIVENKPLSIVKTETEYICTECNVAKILCSIESLLICPSCGDDQVYFDTGVQGLTYEQEVNTDTNVHFAYKRINHFRELLAQLQAKESADIPDEVIYNLRNEFKKERIINTIDITQTKVKAYLKKLKYNKYYENANQITNILTGKPPPQINDVLHEKLTLMFMEIQEPFERVCPKDRKNFLSYNYVLYKLCEILNENDIKNFFPLLKSRQKLFAQDCIWKNICELKKWKYLPSV